MTRDKADPGPDLKPASQWTRTRERGSYGAMRLLVWLYRYGGDYVLTPILYGVVFYFFATRRATRRHSRQYLRRVLPHSVSNWHVWKHHMAFARALMARIGAWMGRVPDESVVFEQRDALWALKKQGQGILFLGAHFGNLDMFRAMVKPGDSYILNIIVHTRHAKKFNRLLQQINPQVQVNLLQVDQITPETAMLLQSKLADGEAVVLLADRVPAGTESRHFSVDFLGSQARFPFGPFWLATLLEAPVFFMTSVYTGAAHQMVVTPLQADSPAISRRQRGEAARQLFDRYVQQLEELCRRYPFQWFNFYDFWLDDNYNNDHPGDADHRHDHSLDQSNEHRRPQ